MACGSASAAEDLVAFPKKIHQVAPGAAARIHNPHAGSDAAAEQLIEQVDVDRAELLGKTAHRADAIGAHNDHLCAAAASSRFARYRSRKSRIKSRVSRGPRQPRISVRFSSSSL